MNSSVLQDLHPGEKVGPPLPPPPPGSEGPDLLHAALRSECTATRLYPSDNVPVLSRNVPISK